MVRFACLLLLVACSSSPRPDPSPDAQGPDAPVTPKLTADDASFTTLVNVPLSGTLHATSSTGTAFIYRIVEPPATGTLTLVDDVAGTFTYDPGPTGVIAKFRFKATDLTLDSNVADVTLKVNTATSNELVVVLADTNQLPAQNEDPHCIQGTLTRRGDVDYLATTTVIDLANLPANTQLYGDDQCQLLSPTQTQLAIAIGQHDKRFGMRIQTAGTANLTFSATGFTPAIHAIATTAGYPKTMEFTTVDPPSSCRKLTVSFADTWGNPTATWLRAGDPPLAFYNSQVPAGSSPATFFRDAACQDPFTTQLIDGGTFYDLPVATTATFFVKQSGPVTIVAGFSNPQACNSNIFRICRGVSLD